jgi:hypothetical protein
LTIFGATSDKFCFIATLRHPSTGGQPTASTPVSLPGGVDQLHFYLLHSGSGDRMSAHGGLQQPN